MINIQIPKTEKKKAPGGQEIETLVRARVKLWYKEVKDRKEIEDSELDDMFIWWNAADHLNFGPQKIFERIGKVGMITRGNKHRRSLAEIIKFVDQYPDFQGTAFVYNSKLWELFELKSISEADILRRIDDVFIEHGVERMSVPVVESWRFRRNPDLDILHPVNPFEIMKLKKTNLHKITWEYLGLLFLFFMKTTILRDNKRLIKLHTDSVKKYFEERLGDFGQKCAFDAIEKIQNIEVIRKF